MTDRAKRAKAIMEALPRHSVRGTITTVWGQNDYEVTIPGRPFPYPHVRCTAPLAFHVVGDPVTLLVVDGNEQNVIILDIDFTGATDLGGPMLDNWAYIGGPPNQAYYDPLVQSILFNPIVGPVPLPFTGATIAMTNLGGPAAGGVALSPHITAVGPSPVLSLGKTIGIRRSSTNGIVFQSNSPTSFCDQVQIMDGGGNVTLLTEICPSLFPGVITGVGNIQRLSADDTYAYACCNANMLALVNQTNGSLLYGLVDENLWVSEAVCDVNGTITVLTGTANGSAPGEGGYQVTDGIGNLIDFLSCPLTVYAYQFSASNVTGNVLNRLSKTTMWSISSSPTVWGVSLSPTASSTVGCVAGKMGYSGFFQNEISLTQNLHTVKKPATPDGLIYDANANLYMVATRNATNTIGAWDPVAQAWVWQVTGGNNANTVAGLTPGQLSYEDLYPQLAGTSSTASAYGGTAPNGAVYAVLYNHCEGRTATYGAIDQDTSWAAAYEAFITDANNAAAINDTAACVGYLESAIGSIPSTTSIQLTVWLPVSNYWGVRLYDTQTGVVITDTPLPSNARLVQGTQNAGGGSINNQFWPNWRGATASYAYTGPTGPIAEQITLNPSLSVYSLTTAITSSATTTFTSTGGWPNVQVNDFLFVSLSNSITFQSQSGIEAVQVTGISGNDLTVTRGALGTTALSSISTSAFIYPAAQSNEFLPQDGGGGYALVIPGALTGTLGYWCDVATEVAGSTLTTPTASIHGFTFSVSAATGYAGTWYWGALVVNAPIYTFAFDPGPWSMQGLFFTDPACNSLGMVPANSCFDIAGDGGTVGKGPCSPIDGTAQQPVIQVWSLNSSPPLQAQSGVGIANPNEGGFSNPVATGGPLEQVIILQQVLVAGIYSVLGWVMIIFVAAASSPVWSGPGQDDGPHGEIITGGNLQVIGAGTNGDSSGALGTFFGMQ